MANIAIHQPRASYILGGAEAISIEIAKVLSLKHKISFVTSEAKHTENFDSFFKEYKDIILFVFIESPLVYEFQEKGKLNAFDFESIVFGENSSAFYEKNSFDAIISHYCTDLITLNKKGSRIILHLHGYPKEKRFINDISYRLADILVGCSKFALEETLAFFPDMKGGFFFHMRPDLKDFKINNSKKVIDILFVGRLIERKGVRLLIESLKKIESSFNNCVIAGGGPIEEEMKKLIQDLGLIDKVQCIGPIEKTKVIELLNKSKIFVHPTVSREPFPTTLIEAMSMGVPIISTPIGGIPEMITNNVNGILVEPKKDALSEAILKLLSDKLIYQKLVSGGIKKIDEDFNKNKKTLDFLNFYDKLLGDIK